MAHGHTEQDVLFRGGPLSEISTDWHPPSPAICQNRRGACHSSLYWAIVNVREVKEGERKEGGRNERKKERKKGRKARRMDRRVRQKKDKETRWIHGDIISSIPWYEFPRGTASTPRRALRVLI